MIVFVSPGKAWA